MIDMLKEEVNEAQHQRTKAAQAHLSTVHSLAGKYFHLKKLKISKIYIPI